MTVLNQPAEDRHDAAVQWRQLVDLVARAGANSGSHVVGEALAAIRGEASRVEETLRAAAARAVAALPLPLALLEYFASEPLAVSAPVLAAATLDRQQWRVLEATADEETRRFILALHPELGSEPRTDLQGRPAEAANREAIAVALASPSAAYAPPSLHDMVERIEQRRRMRAGQPYGPIEAPPPPIESPALFRWECGPGGEIAWVDGVPRGALIGRSIARPVDGDGDRLDADVVRAFTVRAPFRDGSMILAAAGTVAGEWKISGVPAFDPADGRFAGYRGVAHRDTAAAEQPDEAVPEVLADPASVRELVHEIKTPLNAIIGFAEIIEGQYFGPADSGYRDRAREIVRQARLLLAAIDDLDLAAKLHAGGGERERADLAALVDTETGVLKHIAAEHGVEIAVVRQRLSVQAAVEPELVARLLLRLFTALADRAAPGERLQVAPELAGDAARIAISRPAALRRMAESALFKAGSEKGERPGPFGLHLVRGLARIAGGDLVASRDSLAITFRRA